MSSTFCKVLEYLEASLAGGAAAVDGKGQVLRGDADLVAVTLVRAALSEAVPGLRVSLGHLLGVPWLLTAARP